MKLSKAHMSLLGDVAAGVVWRTGSAGASQSTVERAGQRGSAPDVTVLVDALHREFLVTLAPAQSPAMRGLRRQWRLTSWGERRLAAGA